MAFTYNGADITNYTSGYISAIRFLINDTVESNAQLSDEELTALYNDIVDTWIDDTYKQLVYRTAISAAQYLQSNNNVKSWSSAGTSVTYGNTDYSALVNKLSKILMRDLGIASIIYTRRDASYY